MWGFRRPSVAASAVLFLLGGTTVTACSSGSKPSRPPVTSRASATNSTTGGGPDSAAVQLGFGGTEKFCAQPPLTGHILYDGSTGTVHLTLAVGGLPPDSDIGLNWLNNTVRGYEIAAFRTDSLGHATQNTLRIFRAGEAHGFQIMLATTGQLQSTPVGRLDPCN